MWTRFTKFRGKPISLACCDKSVSSISVIEAAVDSVAAAMDAPIPMPLLLHAPTAVAEVLGEWQLEVHADMSGSGHVITKSVDLLSDATNSGLQGGLAALEAAIGWTGPADSHVWTMEDWADALQCIVNAGLTSTPLAVRVHVQPGRRGLSMELRRKQQGPDSPGELTKHDRIQLRCSSTIPQRKTLLADGLGLPESMLLTGLEPVTSWTVNLVQGLAAGPSSTSTLADLKQALEKLHDEAAAATRGALLVCSSRLQQLLDLDGTYVPAASLTAAALDEAIRPRVVNIVAVTPGFCNRFPVALPDAAAGSGGFGHVLARCSVGLPSVAAGSDSRPGVMVYEMPHELTWSDVHASSSGRQDLELRVYDANMTRDVTAETRARLWLRLEA
jgi:hypothetical protein